MGAFFLGDYGMRKMVIIDNKREHTLHLVNRIKKTEARLAPGFNRIPLEAWTHLLAEANVQDRVDEGWLVVQREEEEEVDVNYFLNENAARARTMAKKMSFDRTIMTEWASKEKRKSVKDVLDARLAEMKE
jgi:hypothetical protein